MRKKNLHRPRMQVTYTREIATLRYSRTNKLIMFVVACR